MTGGDEPGGQVNSLGEDWRGLLAVGLIVALLGVLAIVFPFVTGLSLSWLLGGLLVAGGLAHGWQVLRVRGWTGRIWQAILAFVYVLAGFALFVNPLLGLTTLALLAAGYLLVSGVLEVVMGARLRGDRGGGWLVASGILSLVLAYFVWVGWPANASWSVGFLFGLALLASGIAMSLVAWSGRRAGRVGASEAPTGEL